MTEPPSSRDRLLDAAGELFQRQGFAATGLNELLTVSGTPEVATDPRGLEVSDVFVMLKPRERIGTSCSARTRPLGKAMIGNGCSCS